MQTYLLPAALLICLFFCTAAYSEKKNRVYGEDADRDINFNNGSYKRSAAGTDCDIITYNKKKSKLNDDYDYDEEEPVKQDIKKGPASKSSKDKVKILFNKTTVEYVYYIVKKGDTLFSIAKRSGISLKRIQDFNNLNEDLKIHQGMKLKIPSKNSVIKISSGEPAKKNPASKPEFLWPLKKVKCYNRDGKDGVKPIGIIIKGNPGGEVIASENGIVKKVGYMRGYGKYIVVGHDGKYITVYSNLMEVEVKTGDTVKRGGRIGNISDDMTLHFQIDRAGKPENPIILLPKRG